MKSFDCQKWCAPRGVANFARRLTVICVLIVFSAIFFLASPVQAQPTISSFPAPLPQGQVGTTYNATLTVAGGTLPYTWGTAVGLPPGLSFTAAGNTGTISGTPTTTGTFPFSITVTDSTLPTPDSGTFTSYITITAIPITFLTTSLPHATEGSTYSKTITISGGTSPYTWTIASGILPSGLTLHATSGIISGTPDEGTAGTHSFTVEVTDSSIPSLSGQRSFSITIEKGSYESIVSITSSLLAGETEVFVDGGWVATLEGGESTQLNFEPGTSQTITVDSTVSHPTKTDVRFGTEMDRIVVSELSPDAHFSYYAAYFIEFRTDPAQVGEVTGTG